MPEITVQLAELTISQNAIQRAVEGVKNEIVYQLGNIDWLAVGMKYFLRKDATEDVSRTETTFAKTVSFGVPQPQMTSRAASNIDGEESLPQPPAEIKPSGDASFESVNVKGNTSIEGNTSIRWRCNH